jgi:hypothetical protein
MQDGTYLIKPNGDIVNYGERWAYGFFVAEGRKGFSTTSDSPVKFEDYLNEAEILETIALRSPQSLVGVWTAPDSGNVYIDPVTHISDYASAVKLGRDNGELAIWDAFKSEEIYLADL